MREGWQRGEAALALDRSQIERLIRHAFPAARALAGGPKAVLLRLYQRDPAQAPKEAAGELGQALAAIHDIGFAQAGFLDGDLRVAKPVDRPGRAAGPSAAPPDQGPISSTAPRPDPL
jgi:hypothetical protein